MHSEEADLLSTPIPAVFSAQLLLKMLVIALCPKDKLTALDHVALLRNRKLSRIKSFWTLLDFTISNSPEAIIRAVCLLCICMHTVSPRVCFCAIEVIFFLQVNFHFGWFQGQIHVFYFNSNMEGARHFLLLQRLSIFFPIYPTDLVFPGAFSSRRDGSHVNKMI